MVRPEDWISICLDRRDVNIKSLSTREEASVCSAAAECVPLTVP